MYALVAIGFVLICKTSGVLNVAQGAMALFAALTFVSRKEHGVPFIAALVATVAIMAALGFAIERMVLRPLASRSPMTLFMASLGLSHIIEGAAQIIWGTQGPRLDLGISNDPYEVADIFIANFDLVAAALVAGLLWGARLGVQFSLSLIVLKALLVLGGFHSVLAAFMAVGAYAAYNLMYRLPGLSLPVELVLAAAITAAVRLVFGLPRLRLRGFYLAVSTLAAQFFVGWSLNKLGWFSNYSPSGMISAPSPGLFGVSLDSMTGRYLLAFSVITGLGRGADHLALWGQPDCRARQ